MNNNKHHFPDWLDLQTLWMEKHFSGQSAVVISNSVSTAKYADFDVIKKYALTNEGLARFFGSQFFVYECSEVQSHEILEDLREGKLFSLFWNGSSFTNET